VESGTFDELVARGGRFRELAQAQFMVRDETAKFASDIPSTHDDEGADARGR